MCLTYAVPTYLHSAALVNIVMNMCFGAVPNHIGC